MNATLTDLPLENIWPDNKQPRKFFDQKAMDELVESVKQQGILQPIMVRPSGTILFPKEREGQREYRIVCGERRLRAAEAAGLTEIPCVVRDLSDDEVLEIQIVENLQRKDVNPMEEAIAFSRLRDRWDLGEIAHRVGKSAQYVAQRISLTNLVDGWQKILFEGKITLSVAYKLARMAPKIQEQAYKECVDKRDGEIIDWKLNETVDDNDHDLDSATFKTEDPDLYPEAGACGSCQYNSAANQLLFPDLNKKRICHNPACYLTKTERAYKINLEAKAQEADVVFVQTVYGDHDKKAMAKIKAAESLGVKVLSNDDFEVVKAPEQVQPWEEWLEESKDQYDYEDMDEAEKKKFLAEQKEEYDEVVSEYQSDMVDFEEKVKQAQKAFVVAGDSWRGKEGQEIYIVPKKGKGKAVAAAAAKDPTSAELASIDEEIAGIEQRRARNRELDREKVFVELAKKLRDPDGSFLTSKEYLTGAELPALILAMAQSWPVERALEQATGKDYDRDHVALLNDLEEAKDISKTLAFAARHFILDKLNSAQEIDPEKYGKASALMALAIQYMPTTVEQLEMEQNEKASKREANIDKRVSALLEKKAALQEEATRAANEAAAKKAQKSAKSKAK